MFQRLLRGTTGLAAAYCCSTDRSFLCAKKSHHVYVWGNGFYQARPDALLQFENFRPHKVDNLPAQLVKIRFGDYYDAGVCANGQLYVWDKRAIDSNPTPGGAGENTRQNVTLIGKGIKEVRFTAGYMWGLSHNGEVAQWPIVKTFDSQGKNVIATRLGEKKIVEPLKDSIQLQTGTDHVITLSKNGDVFSMGDDTYGQCGQPDSTRNTHPPWSERRVKAPVKVKNLKKIVKITSAGNHCLALDENGNLYGWGSNSSIQLSHEEEFSQMNTPLLCSYNPIKISKGLDNAEIKGIIAGEEFSILNTVNKNTDSAEVYSFGNNLKGQLGIGEIKHVRDISKIEALSNYVLKENGKQLKVKVDQIECGNYHCIALLNIGYIMEWGDNEYGQMGNRRRASVPKPILLRDFVGKKVVGVFAGQYNSAVIIEEAEDTKKSEANK